MIRPAVIHAQGALANATAAISSGYPVVLTVHGMQREESRHQVSPYLRLRKLVAARLVESPNLRKATHLIAIGRYVVNYFAGLLHPDARVYYIPNGITESFFEVQENEPGKQILFAGRVIRRKRVLDLLQAFRQVHRACPGARLRLAGECASEIPYVRKVLSFVKSSGLEQVVHLLGPLSEREILQEFGHCDLLVLPSGQETAPMVIAQAMAAGKPVIATSVGGITEMVEHGSTGLIIEPGDVPALTASLLRLLDDPPLCRRMGEAGHRRALEEYRASAVAKQTFEVYGEIARTSASL